MEAIKSFKGYGKVSPLEEQEFRRKTRRRFIIIGSASALLLVIIVGAAVGVAVSRRSDDHSGAPSSSASSTSSPPSAVSQSIKALCSVTQHADLCVSSLSSAAGANATKDPEQLFKFSLEIATGVLKKAASYPAQLAAGTKDPRVKAALEICTEMINDSLDQLNDSVSLMKPAPGEKLLSNVKVDDLKTWLSAVLSNQETCLDGFEGTTGGFREKLATALQNSTMLTSNSLAIANKILGFLGKLNIPIHRKLLSLPPGGESWPSWVGPERRKLMQVDDGSAGPAPAPDAIVAQDGSGGFATIGEALKLVPRRSLKPFVIYVKAGKYVERVFVDKNMWNVVMVGDGMDQTVVSGSENFIDGTPTFNTATFVVEGRGFMAKNMGFENTAGPEKHQAVAVRVKADQATFFRCSFDAYQDTLYTHSLRQFYRDCSVKGTIDFIFGDASVVFQGCDILPRQPLPNQFNTITAQGRTDPSENTGISIQRCSIRPLGTVTAATYLGRPWKPYSTTVVMTSEIAGAVHPKGWLSWDGVTAPPDTIFYGEYMNTGPGAGTAGRVDWVGFRPALTDDEAQRYAVGPFIQGDTWLPSTGVVYAMTL